MIETNENAAPASAKIQGSTKIIITMVVLFLVTVIGGFATYSVVQANNAKAEQEAAQEHSYDCSVASFREAMGGPAAPRSCD